MALTKEQTDLLERLGLPTDFSGLTDDQYFAVDDAVYEEMVMHGINAAGDGLNEHGELCRSIIVELHDD